MSEMASNATANPLDKKCTENNVLKIYCPFIDKQFYGHICILPIYHYILSTNIDKLQQYNEQGNTGSLAICWHIIEAGTFPFVKLFKAIGAIKSKCLDQLS